MKRFFTHFLIIFVILCAMVLPAAAAQMLIPGGQVIGMHLADDTVSVAAIHESLGEAAKAAGLAVGDRIVAIDGHTVHGPEDIRTALSKSSGPVDVSILRGGKAKKLRFTPAATDGGPRLGVYLKQGTTGIGTVTYYDPGEQTFGALGHGVHDPAGQLLSLTQGSIYQASVLSVKKGTAGTPGQLMGAVTDTVPLGNIEKNTHRGVFGQTSPDTCDPLPIGGKDTVRTGPATIRSTVNGGGCREYSVEILKIYPSMGDGGRNMLLRVTDPALLEACGGIVQGMSGSPIIQDGKLVGAVTHVLVNDPTTGYGIFIENMLDAAA